MKKRAQTAKRQQPDKNYIGVTAKIFAVLEYFIQEGAQQQAVSFQELSRRPAVCTYDGSPHSLFIGEAWICGEGRRQGTLSFGAEVLCFDAASSAVQTAPICCACGDARVAGATF